jgi:radical SAM-linked protein
MRIRVTFSKTDSIQYSGHLDLQRVWERWFRRSQLPVSYSQGFNPQVKIQIACALPLGFTSHCELLDFWLESELSLDVINMALGKTAPPGIDIIHLEQIDLQSPTLQTLVIACQYLVTLLDFLQYDELNQRVMDLLHEQTITRTRRGKSYDLRPLIESLSSAISSNNESLLQIRLSARQNATGRPEEVLAALGLDPFAARYERIGLILTSTG